MNEMKHTHVDNIIVDADKHFTINTVTRAITPDPSYKKITLMQYDNKSERYSFTIDRKIEGHDVMNCNRVQIHFINIGSNKEKHPGLYLVEDVQINEEDGDKVSFTWLISQDATQLSGILSFLISFECVDGETVLYRWSTSIFNQIQITAGMDNDNTILELYADELLSWQNQMETELIPVLVDQCYVERDFATSEEVGSIFGLYQPGEDSLTGMTIDDIPTENSENLVKSGGVKSYIDDEIAAMKSYVDEKEQSPVNLVVDDIPTDNSENLVKSGGVKSYIDDELSAAKLYVDGQINSTIAYIDDSIQSAITSALGGDY